jgi:tetratricopeptide (TPR) repeat protein
VATISSDEFACAIQYHQAGDLAAATRMYESILQRDSTNANVFHLLGLLHHQQGYSQLAAQLIGRAVSLQPEVPVFRATLGETHRALGQFDLAAACCQSALDLGLADPEIHNNLGLSLQAMGRRAEAARAFRAALDLRPDDATFHTNLGSVLQAMDEKEQALIHLRRAVSIDPTLAPAQSNLGQLLLDLGLPDQALPHCREAVALDPNLPEAYNNLGNAHRALGQLPEAKQCYFSALRLDRDLAQAHVNVGLTLQQEECWDEALTWLRRATELQGDSMVFLELLAASAVDRERFDEAIDCYQRILQLDASLAAAHNTVGWLLQEQARFDEAGEHLRTALRLRPDLGLAHLNLGSLYEKLGDARAAESSLRAALPDPEAGAPALARLAMLLRDKLPESDRAAIEQRLSSTDLADPARINLLFALGYVWDARRRYSEAARCAREANALTVARLEKRKLAYDCAAHERLVSGLIAAFDPSFFARLAEAGRTTRRPVFIVGMPRSGTSLIEQILASHSQFYGAGELQLAQHAFEAIPEVLNRTETPLACVADLNPTAVGQLARWHDEQLAQLDGGKAPRIIDKMPENYLYLGLLATLFPRSVFIHCRRDPRDIATSCWLTGFRSVRWASDKHHIASRFQQYHRLMNHWRTFLPAPIHEVQYEEAVAETEAVARRLLAACDMSWEPACLDFHKTHRPVRTASSIQVRQPVYRSSVGRWKHYQRELADVFDALPLDQGSCS